MSELPALLEICRSGSPEQQWDALHELKTLGDASLIPEILPLLSAADDRVREAAADALGELGAADPERIGAALLPLLQDDVHLVRDQAAEIFGRLCYQGAIAPLKRLLHADPEWLVRATAAEALGHFADASLLPDLEQALEEDEEPSVQGYAAGALGLLAPTSYGPKLEAYLAAKGDSLEVTIQLLVALYRLGAPEAFQRLLRVIDATEDLAETFFLLNRVEEMTQRNPPTSLPADAPRLRQSLIALGQRCPIEQPHIETILDTLQMR